MLKTRNDKIRLKLITLEIIQETTHGAQLNRRDACLFDNFELTFWLSRGRLRFSLLAIAICLIGQTYKTAWSICNIRIKNYIQNSYEPPLHITSNQLLYSRSTLCSSCCSCLAATNCFLIFSRFLIFFINNFSGTTIFFYLIKLLLKFEWKQQNERVRTMNICLRHQFHVCLSM